MQGTVTGVFGSQRILNGKPRSPHLGIDIAAEEGANIVSPAPGRILLAKEDMFFTGKTIMVDHGFGLTSIYAHLKEFSPKIQKYIKTQQYLNKSYSVQKFFNNGEMKVNKGDLIKKGQGSNGEVSDPDKIISLSAK